MQSKHWLLPAFLLVSFVFTPLYVHAASITIGDTNVESINDGSNANFLFAQQATLSQSATIQSLSFYVRTASGNLRLGVYDATGPSGSPGALKAQTNSFTPVTGWNTQPVVTPVSLPAGTYWLAYLPQNNGLGFQNVLGTGLEYHVGVTFGSLPTTFPTAGEGQGADQWSFYGTLNVGPDTTPPSVAITSPTNGGFASSTAFSVIASASDNVAVANVQFFLDGANLGSPVTTSPYKISWNTTTVAPGSHTLLAQATDTSGNVATSSPIIVTVDNQAPSGTISINGGAPATNSTAVTLNLSATDTNGVTQMRFSNTGTSFNAPVPYAVSSAWTLTTGAGTKTVYAQFKDSAGNWSSSITSTIILDTTAPTISAVASSNITSSSATITWTTNEPATSQENYGVTTSYGATTTLDTTLVTSHSEVISGLSPNTTYDYRVRSKDAAGNEKVGSNATFKTLSGPDTTPPTVSLTAPAQGVTVSGSSVSLVATASDNVAVGGVTFKVDGSIVGSEDTTSPYSVLWNSISVADGSHTIVAVARDTSGNLATSTAITITTDNTPPIISGISSTPTQTTATISWTTDEPSNTKVVYGLTTAYGSASASAPLVTAHTSMLSSLMSGTTYHFAAVSADAQGNTSTSSDQTFDTIVALPDTEAPSIPTSLVATNVTSSSATISWSASSDNVGVVGYQVFRGGIQVGTTTTTTFGDAGLTASTTYAYTVTAFDAAGNVSMQSDLLTVTTPAQSTGTPTLIQHLSSSANPIGVGISGNNFKIPLPNPVGVGNTLILGMSYPHGTTPTITDSNGNTWPTTAVVSADAGSGGYVSSIFVLPNAKAGLTTLTVSFGSAIIPFEYTISEFDNVATVSPVSGSSATADVSGTTHATGSFTPTNNDANGGNLIWNYYAISGGASGNPTNWAPGSGFTLLDADIAWTTHQGFPHASQYFVQTTDAAINPSITSTGDTEGYNSVAVALKAASAGTAAPAGIHINKIIHQTLTIWPTNGTLAMQFPTTGNLRVLEFSYVAAGVTSITDSDGGTWTEIQSGNDGPGMWYAPNRPANPNLVVTFHISGGAGVPQSVRFFDISGAAASPLDVTAGATSIDVSGQTVANNLPVITPTTVNGLVIAGSELGDGPGLGFNTGAPANAVWDLTTYTGEIDEDLMENADLLAHLYNTDLSTLHWNWHITSNPNNSAGGVAAAFKAGS